MAIYSAAQFLSAPFWGRLSDRVGRRPVLLGTIFAASLAYVWLAYADTLIMLFAARAVGGLMAGNISTAFAYAADKTTRENRAKGMGMIGAAFGLHLASAPQARVLVSPAFAVDIDTPTHVASFAHLIAS